VVKSSCRGEGYWTGWFFSPGAKTMCGSVGKTSGIADKADAFHRKMAQAVALTLDFPIV